MFNKQISILQKKGSPRAIDSAASSNAEGRRMSNVPSIVSADLTIRGDLAGGGDLQIEGKVIGRVDVRHLVVTESGAVEGEIVATAVRLAGEVSGTIRAASVTLAATAKIQGDILYETLTIESGAQLEGQCRRMSAGHVDKLLSSPTVVVEKAVA